jgi:iron complex outermembrane receptor protein
VAAYWTPFDTWRLDASYSALRITPSVDAASLDARATLFDGAAPRRQWHARSTWWADARTQVHAAIYRAGALPQFLIPAYTRLDAGLEFRLPDGLTAALTGQNLLDRSHQEFSGVDSGVLSSSIPRSARVQLRWQY